MPSVWEIAEGGKGINESKEAGKRRCLDDAGTAGVPPAMSAKREQWLLAVGSFAGGTPAVPANGDLFSYFPCEHGTKHCCRANHSVFGTSAPLPDYSQYRQLVSLFFFFIGL